MKTQIVRHCDFTIIENGPSRESHMLRYQANSPDKSATPVLVASGTFENSALESSFFKIFAFSTPNAEKIRRNLASATRDHRERFVLWLDRIEQVERIEQGERLVA